MRALGFKLSLRKGAWQCYQWQCYEVKAGLARGSSVTRTQNEAGMSNNRSKVLGPTREVIAHHEAGHSVAAHVLRSGASMAYAEITVVPRGDTLGQHSGESGLGENPSPQEIENKIVELFAGYAAEVKHSPERQEAARGTASDDDQQAEVLFGWLGLKGDKLRERETWLRLRTKALIEEHWTATTALASDLLEHDTIEGDEAVATGLAGNHFHRNHRYPGSGDDPRRMFTLQSLDPTT
jgi:hypothetical protein